MIFYKNPNYGMKTLVGVDLVIMAHIITLMADEVGGVPMAVATTKAVGALGVLVEVF